MRAVLPRGATNACRTTLPAASRLPVRSRFRPPRAGRSRAGVARGDHSRPAVDRAGADAGRHGPGVHDGRGRLRSRPTSSSRSSSASIPSRARRRTSCASVTENPTGRPVFAQLIGESIPHLLRDRPRAARARPSRASTSTSDARRRRSTARTSGAAFCATPRGSTRSSAALRAAVPGLLTVKMRIGFDDCANFERILALVDRHGIDLLTVHGRTVKEMYRGEVHYDRIARAVQRSAARCLRTATSRPRSAPPPSSPTPARQAS